MSLQLVTPPALEPVTLADAKAHLKVDTSDDDALIARLIPAARARAEWHTGRALIAQSWILWLDCWRPIVDIPLPPLVAVSAVTAYARDDTPNALTPVLVDLPGSRVLLDPVTDLRCANALAIAFDAGYGDAAEDVPAALRAAILAIVAELYVHRGDGPAELSGTAQALLAPYRMFKL
ncbi:MAG TPA: head-tail connector protein [Rhizomicrobium sp.]|nr:head-tail connector protein [Rhizomicrobium sp.]